jgi:hypothetical protein
MRHAGWLKQIRLRCGLGVLGKSCAALEHGRRTLSVWRSQIPPSLVTTVKDPTMAPTLSRRAFLVRSSAVTAGVVAASLTFAAPAMADPATSTAWVLHPTGGCRCAACRSHAANRIFASAVDASAGRAHPGCRCVPAAIEIGTATRHDFFSGTNVVDRRHPGVDAILTADRAQVTARPAQQHGPPLAPNAGPAYLPARIAPPAIAGSSPPHAAAGATVTRLDPTALEWTPLPVAATALGLILWLRNRREDDATS